MLDRFIAEGLQQQIWFVAKVCSHSYADSVVFNEQNLVWTNEYTDKSETVST